VGNSPRREFSKKTKRLAWDRCEGRCEGMLPDGRCNAPLDLGCFHYDHIDPDWFSKDNELANCAVICRPCHTAKTADDVADIAKSKRIQDRQKGIRKRSSFRGWRRFNGEPVFAEKNR
jgi:5-methylcytosine-specific restriction enzyme A